MRYKLGKKKVVHFRYNEVHDKKYYYNMNGRLICVVDKTIEYIYTYDDDDLLIDIKKSGTNSGWNINYTDGRICEMCSSGSYISKIISYNDNENCINVSNIKYSLDTFFRLNNFCNESLTNIKVLNYGYIDPVVMFLV